MSSSLKTFLWILIGFPIIFLISAWSIHFWNLFYISIPVAVVVSLLGYFVSKKYEGSEGGS